MLIKDVTEQTKVSADTLRYYEKEGLISKPHPQRLTAIAITTMTLLRS